MFSIIITHLKAIRTNF